MPVYRSRMTDPEKQTRLAQALRANLKRRKAQAREQAAGGESVSQSELNQSEKRSPAS